MCVATGVSELCLFPAQTEMALLMFWAESCTCGVALGLSGVRTGICQRETSTKLQEHSLCCLLRRFCWVGPVARPAACLQSTAGVTVRLVCGYLLLSLKQDSFWSGADLCLGCAHTARLVALLWWDQEWLEGVDLLCCSLHRLWSLLRQFSGYFLGYLCWWGCSLGSHVSKGEPRVLLLYHLPIGLCIVIIWTQIFWHSIQGFLTDTDQKSIWLESKFCSNLYPRHSSNKYFLSIYCVSDTILVTGDRMVAKTKSLPSQSLYSSGRWYNK